jgi:flagellar biosynthesis component FlhA
VEQNDYVNLAHLLVTRSKIETALNEVESVYQSEFNTQVTTNHRIGNALKNAAEKMEAKGEDMLLMVTTNLGKLNDSTHSMITNATALSNKTISKGNQLGHDAGRFLIHKTSEGFSKFANSIQKRS